MSSLVILTFQALGYVHHGCNTPGLLFIILQPLFLYRRDMTNQGGLVLLETDRLLREQTEDGCELLLSSDCS